MSATEIVIIDDERNIANYYSKMVSSHFGNDVHLHTFYFSDDLLTYSQEHHFDLMICDIDMPGKDGITLAKEIKKSNPDLEVIFLTGLNNFNNAYQAFQVENASYLLKIDAEENLILMIQSKIKKIHSHVSSMKQMEGIIQENNTLQEQVISEELRKILHGETPSKENVKLTDSYLGCLEISEINSEIKPREKELMEEIIRLFSIRRGEIVRKEDHVFAFLFHHPNQIKETADKAANVLVQEYHVSVKIAYTTFILKVGDFKDMFENIHKYTEKKTEIDRPIQIFPIDQEDQTLQEMNSDTSQLNEIKKFIWDNLSNDVSLNSIAHYLHYNPSYLSRNFKKKYNINIKDFILEIKINKAKYLLQDTDLFVKDISQSLGFDSISHFFRIFKKNTGYTPSEYRAKFHKK